jgi:hypothetical protein
METAKVGRATKWTTIIIITYNLSTVGICCVLIIICTHIIGESANSCTKLDEKGGHPFQLHDISSNNVKHVPQKNTYSTRGCGSLVSPVRQTQSVWGLALGTLRSDWSSGRKVLLSRHTLRLLIQHLVSCLARARHGPCAASEVVNSAKTQGVKRIWLQAVYFQPGWRHKEMGSSR